jgi:hypothetical protein
MHGHQLHNSWLFTLRLFADYTRDHAEIPVFAIGIYLAIVFQGVTYIEKPLKLRQTFASWNLFLAIFSAIGVTRTVPVLISTLYQRGFFFTLCEDPQNWYVDGPCGLWTFLFIYSKIPELLDTVFLVLQKKPVIFLHWFHHVTVLLYCWHAYHNRIAPGLWFAAMNFTVHRYAVAHPRATLYPCLS